MTLFHSGFTGPCPQQVTPGPPSRQRTQTGCTNRWRLERPLAGDLLGQAQVQRAVSLTHRTTRSAGTLRTRDVTSSLNPPLMLTDMPQTTGLCSGVHSSPEHSFYLLSQEVTQNAKPDAVLECLGSIWELHGPFLARSETLAELYANCKKQRNILLQSRAGSSRTAPSSGWCGSAGRWGRMLREDGGMGMSRGSLRRPILLQLPVRDPSITKEALSFALRTLYRPAECPERWEGALLSVATMLGMSQLYQRCLNEMMVNITSSTVCDFHRVACKHNQTTLQSACERWLELFLVTELSHQIGLRDLPFDLLLKTLRCPRVFAVNEYDLLKTVLNWTYLQLNTTEQTPPSHSAVSSFFCRPAGVFLEQPVGQMYLPLFQALRLHGITERNHVKEIQKINVFPPSWLLLTFSNHYYSIHSGGDMHMTDFSKHSIRFGMIVEGVQYSVFSAFIFQTRFAFILLKVTQVFSLSFTQSYGQSQGFYELILICQTADSMGLQHYTRAVGLYGFYFLLKASRVGQSDAFDFSMERLRHWDPALTESCRTTQPFSVRTERCVCYQVRVQSCVRGEWQQKCSGVVSQVFGLSKRCCRSKVFPVDGLSTPLYVTFALAFPSP
ncbi:BTB/POZ domain-containing protein 16 [Colossoma macropomum]|uniref:BTB/POZ domain-containing protein 16 n=1 Tax=Colossoma macropomum TaxID=42526 RepID=UPI001863DDCF|nr:BTB/POZ domain-containing protein 16 [Colossoma macropomum]